MTKLYKIFSLSKSIKEKLQKKKLPVKDILNKWADPSETEIDMIEQIEKTEQKNDLPLSINIDYASEKLPTDPESEKKRRIEFKKHIDSLSKLSFSIPILNRLYQLNKLNPEKINDNIYKLLQDEYLLWTAYEKLKANDGALTKGTSNQTADEMARSRISDLITQLKDKTFRFSPARRIEVPKPGKKKLRPITIPNFDDRIIQEAIRIILNTIYEPVFQTIEANHGFRPKRSTRTAMESISGLDLKGMTTALEGDIIGAFDNVNSETLNEILKKKISDKKFLNLINSGFKAGIIKKGKYEDSLLGIPQGGIASPILFNIYMHEFDVYVIKFMETYLEKKNNKENRSKDKTKSSLYEKFHSKSKEIKNSIIRLKKKRPYKSLNPTEQEKLKVLQKAYRFYKTKQTTAKSTSERKKLLKFKYVRYADDWILLSNLSPKDMIQVKENLDEWLNKNLQLRLSPEKTLITNITKEYANFLGFTIKNRQKFSKPKTISSISGRNFKRRSTLSLSVGIGRDRLLTRLSVKGFTNDKNKPIRQKLYLQLSTQEIVLKYTQILMGIFNYYYPNITYKSTLSRFYYILRKSCYHTIANIKKISIAKVIGSYGKLLKITWNLKIKDKDDKIKTIKKEIELPSYRRLMYDTIRRTRKFKTKVPETVTPEDLFEPNTKIKETDFLTIRANVRTAVKINLYCFICGALNTKSNPIESHHIKHVMKGKIIGFSEIMRQVNKRQITCCKQCHIKIHKGQYDGIKLSDLYDPVLFQM